MQRSIRAFSAVRSTRSDRRSPAKSTLGVLAALVLLVSTQGCGFSKSSIGSLQRTSVLQGNVHGGRQPIANAVIQLYAAGQVGVASAATPLLTQTVQTGPDGSFSIANAYTCPSLETPVYLVSRGGNPGLHTGVNPSITLMAAIGTCGTLNGLDTVTLNEVTTVGAVFALAPFMTSYAQVGTDPALSDDFAGVWTEALEFADPVSGSSPGPDAISFASVPVAKINTLANILATCINSNGGNAGDGTLCGLLFAYTSANGTTPADTTNALLQIARDPSWKARQLFSLASPLGPFEPALTVAPADWGLTSSAGLVLAVPPPAVGVPPTGPGVPVPPPPSDPEPPAPPVLVPPVVAVPTGTIIWYGRADGGSLYHATRNPSGQCDGKANVSYAAAGGTGVNQHCAFAELEYLWNPGGEYRTLAFTQSDWLIASGDTVILDAAKQWRVGWHNGSNSWDGDTGRRWGVAGNSYQSILPSPPAGTATAHTRILGSNFASCNIDGKPKRSALTQIFGGYGLDTVLGLHTAQYLDMECIDLTRHSNCIRDGSPSTLPGCHSGLPVDDYARDGIDTTVNTHDVLLQDMWIHGFPERGIKGPIGGLFTVNRVDIDTNGMTGWDFDDGTNSNCVGTYCQGTASIHGVVRASYLEVEWSGCDQEYPFVSSKPVAECFGQSNQGQGDGLGTPANNGMDFYIDHSSFHHNTQDGLDLIHVDVDEHVLSVTNSIAYFNSGQQMKWGGGFKYITFNNNILLSGCGRMGAPMTGLPAGYNASLGDFCRAFDLMTINFYNGSIGSASNNTLVGYNSVLVDIGCSSSSCRDTTFTFTNNILRAYDYTGRPSYSHAPSMLFLNPGPGAASGQPLGTFIRDHNLYFGGYSLTANERSGVATNETAINEVAVDPNFINEPSALGSELTLDAFNFALRSNSPAIAAGTPVTGVTTDFTDAPRDLFPSLGALEPGSAMALPVYPASSH